MRNIVQKAGALLSAVRLIRDPNRLDEVFSMAEKMDDPEIIKAVVNELSLDAACARAFVERPRVGAIDLRALAKLPDGTLGHEFAAHMLRAGLDPSALPTLEAHDDDTYLRAHLYETHDIWHAVTGFHTDVAGELGLQAFYLAQIPSRLSSAILAGGFINTVAYAFTERDARMRQVVRGWILGKRAKNFFGVDWASLWSTPLEDVRAQLGVEIDAVDLVIVHRAA